METKDLRYLLRFLPTLRELSPLLLDDVEASKSKESICRIQQAWDDLESVHCFVGELLKHRPLPF